MCASMQPTTTPTHSLSHLSRPHYSLVFASFSENIRTFPPQNVGRKYFIARILPPPVKYTSRQLARVYLNPEPAIAHSLSCGQHRHGDIVRKFQVT